MADGDEVPRPAWRAAGSGTLRIVATLAGFGLFCWIMFAGSAQWRTAAAAVLLPACTVLLASMAARDLLLLSRGVPVDGVVVAVVERSSSETYDSFSRVAVRYRTPDGVERTCGDDAGPGARPGQPWPVRYHPRWPSIAGNPSVGRLLFMLVVLAAVLAGTIWFLSWVAAGGRVD